MSVEGPGMVYSRDLIPEDPQTTPAYDNIPIVKLTKDQKVVVEAHAILSTGKTHAKWQPTTACGYKNYPQITISEACDGCGQCVEECPRMVLEVDGARVKCGPGPHRRVLSLWVMRKGMPRKRDRGRARNRGLI